MDGSDAFCDWLTIRQDHAPHEPFFAAVEQRFDPATGAYGPRLVPVDVHARNGSAFRVVSDGSRVVWDGNPSRFGRWDSVRGLSVEAAKGFVNESLRYIGLPEFSDGEVVGGTMADRSGTPVGTGAVVTRCDVTTNVATSSAVDFLAARMRRRPSRLRMADVEGTVYFGLYSRERTVRLYDKAADLRAKAVKAARKFSASEGERVEALAGCLAGQGVVRVELEAKRALKAAISGRWQALGDEPMRRLFMREFATMTNDLKSGVPAYPDFSVIPDAAAPWLALYLLGVDVRPRLSRDTFRKYRKLLLPFQYDLAVKNTAPIVPIVRRFSINVPVLPGDYIGPRGFDPDLLEDSSRERIESRSR